MITVRKKNRMLVTYLNSQIRLLRKFTVSLTILCALFLSVSSGFVQRAEAVEPKVATGLEFSAYLAPDGTVWTWGDNFYGGEYRL